MNGHLALDHISGWTSSDFLQFTGDVAASSSNYTEITATSYDEALANATLPANANVFHYTAAQVGSDVIVFDPAMSDAVVLAGVTLANISQACHRCRRSKSGHSVLRNTNSA